MFFLWHMSCLRLACFLNIQMGQFSNLHRKCFRIIYVWHQKWLRLVLICSPWADGEEKANNKWETCLNSICIGGLQDFRNGTNCWQVWQLLLDLPYSFFRSIVQLTHSKPVKEYLLWRKCNQWVYKVFQELFGLILCLWRSKNRARRFKLLLSWPFFLQIYDKAPHIPLRTSTTSHTAHSQRLSRVF